ncbi:MAG: VTT domain-containing protein [Nevskia sp.]|nr:VTT domain-containing protein [Nevskia sp.]
MKQTQAVRIRLIAAAVLLALLAAYLAFTYGSDADGLFRRAASFYAFAGGHAWLLLGLFVLRPLFLLPASLVILLTGMLYGGVLGEAVAVAGLTLSSSIEFLLARSSLSVLLKGLEAPQLERLRGKVNAAPFRAVLLMRLCFVPFDLVNLAAAFARAPLRPFVLATALGVIPTSLPIVLTGAAVDFRSWLAGGSFWPHDAVPKWPYVLASVVLAAAVAGWARRAERAQDA